MQTKEINTPTKEHTRIFVDVNNHVNVYKDGLIEVICPNRYIGKVQAEFLIEALKQAVELAEEQPVQWS